MNALAQKKKILVPDSAEEKTFRTTLYDLIEAMTDENEPPEEDLIVGAILDLAGSGKIKWTRGRRISESFYP